MRWKLLGSIAKQPNGTIFNELYSTPFNLSLAYDEGVEVPQGARGGGGGGGGRGCEMVSQSSRTGVLRWRKSV